MRSTFFVVVMASMLVGCGGAKPKPKEDPWKPVDLQVESPTGPTEIGSVFQCEGKPIQLLRRQGRTYGEDKTRTWYAIRGEKGWLTSRFEQVIYLDGIGLVRSRQPQYDRWLFYRVKPDPQHDEKPIDVRQVVMVGDPLANGRAERALVDRGFGDEARIELYGRDGKLERTWPKVHRGQSKNYIHDFGAYYMIFPDQGGQRMTQLFDRKLNPVGEPMAGIEELRINERARVDKQVSYFGRLVAGEKNLYTLLQQDGRVIMPEGVVGVSPISLNGDKWESYRGAAWLVLFDTPNGRHWGYADTHFTQVSGPIWQDVRRIGGTNLEYLLNGGMRPDTKDYYRAYVVVQEADSKQWHALMPEYPFRALTRDASPTPEKAVEVSEKVCREKHLVVQNEEAASRAVIQQKEEDERKYRAAGGATPEKDKEWNEAWYDQRVTWGNKGQVARKLGGIYWVQYMERDNVPSVDDLRSAAAAAAKFDVKRSQKLTQRANEIANIIAGNKAVEDERRRQAAEEASRPPLPIRRDSTDFGFDFSRSSSPTYDYRTGIRSDTKALQDWTYGRQNWKPLQSR